MVGMTRVLEKPGDWARRGACVGAPDPDIWHAPEKVQGRGNQLTPATAEALAICARCPVSPECLAFALSHKADDDWGVYGGTTERQRRQHRTERERRLVE